MKSVPKVTSKMLTFSWYIWRRIATKVRLKHKTLSYSPSFICKPNDTHQAAITKKHNEQNRSVDALLKDARVLNSRSSCWTRFPRLRRVRLQLQNRTIKQLIYGRETGEREWWDLMHRRRSARWFEQERDRWQLHRQGGRRWSSSLEYELRRPNEDEECWLF